MAGLVAELGTSRVLGVDTGATSDPHHRVESLVRELGADPSDLRLRTDQVGAGYSTVTEPVRSALLTPEGRSLRHTSQSTRAAGHCINLVVGRLYNDWQF